MGRVPQTSLHVFGDSFSRVFSLLSRDLCRVSSFKGASARGLGNPQSKLGVGKAVVDALLMHKPRSIFFQFGAVDIHINYLWQLKARLREAYGPAEWIKLVAKEYMDYIKTSIFPLLGENGVRNLHIAAISLPVVSDRYLDECINKYAQKEGAPAGLPPLSQVYHEHDSKTRAKMVKAFNSLLRQFCEAYRGLGLVYVDINPYIVSPTATEPDRVDPAFVDPQDSTNIHLIWERTLTFWAKETPCLQGVSLAHEQERFERGLRQFNLEKADRVMRRRSVLSAANWDADIVFELLPVADEQPNPPLTPALEESLDQVLAASQAQGHTTTATATTLHQATTTPGEGPKHQHSKRTTPVNSSPKNSSSLNLPHHFGAAGSSSSRGTSRSRSRSNSNAGGRSPPRIEPDVPLVVDMDAAHSRLLVRKSHVRYNHPIIGFQSAILGLNVTCHTPPGSPRVKSLFMTLNFYGAEGEPTPTIKAIAPQPGASTVGEATTVTPHSSWKAGVHLGFDSYGGLHVEREVSTAYTSTTSAQLIASGIETGELWGQLRLTLAEDPTLKRGVPTSFDFAVLLELPASTAFEVALTVEAQGAGIEESARRLFGSPRKYRLGFDGRAEMGSLSSGLVGAALPVAGRGASTSPSTSPKSKDTSLPARRIKFAPLAVPRKRRLQTFAVFAWSVALPLSIGLFFFLCSVPLFWPILIPYLCWMFLLDTAPTHGGRPSDWMRKSRLWAWFATYYPVSLIKTADLPPDRRYVFGYHPHGIIGMGAIANFGTDATGFSELFPGLKPHLLTLATNFQIPLYREILLLMGICSVSMKSCQNILRQGADLVPVFSFGENDIFEQLSNERGTRLYLLQKRFQAAFGFTLPIFFGRGIFNYSMGLMPYRHPIVSVVGRPIHVTQRDNPTIEELQEVQTRYIVELQRIWDNHKELYASGRTRDMMIIA
ncbi:diacylglycerol acyltransferase [Pseudohyphozyma bogoriensis]|nr:diacylglycerol acyltransferase [Pseudohyphozyma bogoriensis]